MTPTNTVSVIIPVYNSGRTLGASLAAIARASPGPFEIVVVDDGSTDDSALIAEQAGSRVVRLGKNLGAAVAKNRGAQAACGDILLFIDSDIVIPPGLFRDLAAALAGGAMDGVVGILSDEVRAADFASQYKNLWMTYTYTRLRGLPKIGLFYTSVAAMRRGRFLALGGFDENYSGASIAEDTEFGQRAWDFGAVIRIVPELAVIHLKTYSLLSLLREDLLRARALSLMRLRKRGQPFFTSVPPTFQLGVIAVYVAIAGLGLIPFSSVEGFASAALALAAVWVLNASLILFLARTRGLFFALQAALFIPIDSLVVGIGMLLAAIDWIRGKRY